MALHDPTVRLTYEDYVLIPEDGRRHEILDGEHYVSAAPFVPHQDLVLWLGAEIMFFLRSNKLGKVYISPLDVLLSPHDIVQPDVIFVSKENPASVTRNNIQGALDLVVEILSDSTRKIDEGIKLRRYERFGVREYWLIDPRSESVRIYRLTESGFHLAARLAKGGVLSTPLLPGLAISVADMFDYSSPTT
ncbi:MAG TPA: Uma2 family endonuclease [Thermoanaerobaculia bacterium]|nr:Uma2 family endonuclease [Thermoanaerobaculia bacterium]